MDKILRDEHYSIEKSSTVIFAAKSRLSKKSKKGYENVFPLLQAGVFAQRFQFTAIIVEGFVINKSNVCSFYQIRDRQGVPNCLKLPLILIYLGFEYHSSPCLKAWILPPRCESKTFYF